MSDDVKTAAVDAAEKLKQPFLEALMDRTPASLRRLGAAAAGVALPFANSVIASKLGVPPVSDSLLMATQAFLTAYIAQSVANEIHARGADAAAKVQTPSEAAQQLDAVSK